MAAVKGIPGYGFFGGGWVLWLLLLLALAFFFFPRGFGTGWWF